LDAVIAQTHDTATSSLSSPGIVFSIPAPTRDVTTNQLPWQRAGAPAPSLPGDGQVIAERDDERPAAISTAAHLHESLERRHRASWPCLYLWLRRVGGGEGAPGPVGWRRRQVQQ